MGLQKKQYVSNIDNDKISIKKNLKDKLDIKILVDKINKKIKTNKDAKVAIDILTDMLNK